MFDASSDLGRDRNRERGKAVHEVGSAVEGIDDPYHIAVAARAAFLGQEGVIGMQAPDRFDDVRFRRAGIGR